MGHPMLLKSDRADKGIGESVPVSSMLGYLSFLKILPDEGIQP